MFKVLMDFIRKVVTYVFYDLAEALRTRIVRKFSSLRVMNPADQPDPQVILVFCPFWQVTFPSVGIGYLASSLESNGIRVNVVDLNLKLFRMNRIDQSFWKTHWYKVETLRKIIDSNNNIIDRYAGFIANTPAKIIGFSTVDINLAFSIELAKKIKALNPDKYIVFGGMGVYTNKNREQLPRDVVDMAVIGEGENIFTRIVDEVLQKGSCGPLPGTYIPASDHPDDTLEESNPPDVKELSFPTFRHFQIPFYTQRVLPVLGTRGCVSRCGFCQDHRFFKKYRYRTPESIVEELIYHYRNNRIRHFAFLDLACNGNVNNLGKIADAIAQSGYPLRWGSNAIPWKKMDADFIQRLHRGGCRYMSYGLESGSTRVLKLMGKLFTAEDAAQVLKQTRDAGIESWINILVGFPGEEEEHFRETITFLETNASSISRIGAVSAMILIPKTPVHDNYHDYHIQGWKPGTTDEWYTESGNTKKIRMERVRAVVATAEKLGIPVDTCNIPEMD